MEKEEAEKLVSKREAAVIIGAMLILILGLINAGAYARKDRRDGQVKQDLRDLKTVVEMYYNQQIKYPLVWDGGKYKYIVTTSDREGATGWYVSGPLENMSEPTAGFDEEYNIDWRVTAEGNYEICGGVEKCARDQQP